MIITFFFVTGVNLYKSIMLSNSERTISVIRKAMEKHGFEGNPEDYTLAQFLPDGGKCILTLILTLTLAIESLYFLVLTTRNLSRWFRLPIIYVKA